MSPKNCDTGSAKPAKMTVISLAAVLSRASGVNRRRAFWGQRRAMTSDL